MIEARACWCAILFQYNSWIVIAARLCSGDVSHVTDPGKSGGDGCLVSRVYILQCDSEGFFPGDEIGIEKWGVDVDAGL